MFIIPCRVYSPQEKGKVENGIKYVKNNFFAGRQFTRNKEMNIELEKWTKKANGKIKKILESNSYNLPINESDKRC